MTRVSVISLDGALFTFLNIFDENARYRLIYKKEGNQVNLAEISETLRANPIIEDGRIARFGKHKDSEGSEV